MLGTRIEVCFLFLRISFGSEMHLWSTPRQLRIQNWAATEKQMSTDGSPRMTRESLRAHALQRASSSLTMRSRSDKAFPSALLGDASSPPLPRVKWQRSLANILSPASVRGSAAEIRTSNKV
mmetsp:Transcript_81411/g.244186  ORF Transcript_81411/g.244186 Transcript_81411/m.244186 type:complete len:122 (+) Transcript_81411:3-368(+)